MLMSTLRNFVQAMGGDLEVRAVFPDRTIEISTFSVLASKPGKSRNGKKKQQLVETESPLLGGRGPGRRFGPRDERSG